jgi:hypothetical protein
VQGKGDGKDGLGGSGNLVLKEEESATLAAIFFFFFWELCSFFAHSLTITYICFG